MPNQENDYVIKEQINSIYRDLTAIHEEAQTEDIDLYIGKIKTLGEILKGKSIFMLLDHRGFNPLYVSENINSLGYSSEQILTGGFGLSLKIVDFRQIYSARHFIKWGRNFTNVIGRDRTLNSWAHICGLAFKDRQRNRRVFMIKVTPILLDKNKELSLSIIQADEITALYKSKSYWVRYCCETGYTPIVRVNFSNKPSKECYNLLTERELEILKLVTQQKKSTEISQELGISKNTVERHRKNMIAKVGVTDMTALITIAQMAEVI